jgi:hypothetical protein
MSHFAVLVIGADYEAQLAPYHEFECTGRNDEYVQEIDWTANVFACAEKNGADPAEHAMFYYDFPCVSDRTEVDRDGAHKYGWAVVRDGKLIEAFQRTNPNKRWDWWMVGGRWTGFLKLKPGAKGISGRPGLMTERATPGYADQSLKGDVDFEQMRTDAMVKARAKWKTCRQITGGLAWESWDDTKLRHKDIEVARLEYHAQPAIEMLKASKNKAIYDFKGVDDHLADDEERFVERAKLRACSLFAFVRDGQWTERDTMGSFGHAADQIDDGQWYGTFNAMLDVLPEGRCSGRGRSTKRRSNPNTARLRP